MAAIGTSLHSLRRTFLVVIGLRSDTCLAALGLQRACPVRRASLVQRTVDQVADE
jgi:hypothetical protein